MNDAAPPQVLVVDDNGELRGMLCELLEGEGYRAIARASGEAAWTQLKGGMRPTVVLLDVALPRMSGRELLVHLRGTSWGLRIRFCCSPGGIARSASRNTRTRF